MSDIVQLTCLCNRIGVPVLNQPQLIYLLTELTPGAALANVQMPLNFALVLDQSGSMAGEKIQTMKEAVKNIVDQLMPTDILSLVAFDGHPRLLVPAQPVAD